MNTARKLPPAAQAALAQPILGLSDIADVYGVSRQLAAKWARTWKDWPEPFAELRAGKFWRTEEVLAVGERHERMPGEGPREAGDPRPPSIIRSAADQARA
jgi:hypothetical protein